MSFDLRRIRERKVVEWSLTYVAGAWLLLEALGFAADVFAWPTTVVRIAFGLAVVGLPVVLVLAWYHGEQGRQRVTGPELVIIAALLGVGGLLLALLTDDRPGMPRVRTSDGELPSVAVLPFQTLGGDEADAAFADGMHDELLHRLAQISGLRVTSRTSVLGIREELGLTRDIARVLGVGHLVEGTAQRAGDEVRVIVQLIDAETDDHLWSDTFLRTLTVENLFDIQSEISAAIAGALAARLTPEERARLADQPTHSLEAYQAYQRGNEAFSYRFFRQRRREAESAYREAIELDPTFADAYAQLARTLVTDFWFLSAFDVVDEIYSLVERAESLAPSRPLVVLARGDILYYTLRDYDAAEESYQRVLELTPSDATTLAQLGLMSDRRGDPAAAVEYLERSLRLDPRSAFYAQQMSYFRGNRGDGAGARRWAERALGLDPTNDTYRRDIVRAELCHRGDTVAARRFIAETDWATPQGRTAALAQLYGFRGEADAALSLWMESEAGPFERAWALHAAGMEATLRQLADSMLAELPDTLDTKRQLAGPFLPHQPGRPWSHRGWLEAFRGNAEAAVRWAREGTYVIPRERDAVQHSWRMRDLVDTYVLVGNYEAALDEVALLLGTPSGLGLGCLRLDPLYAPLRELPRFREILADAESS